MLPPLDETFVCAYISALSVELKVLSGSQVWAVVLTPVSVVHVPNEAVKQCGANEAVFPDVLSVQQ